MIVRFRPGVLDNLPLLGLVHLGLSRRHASNRGGGCPSGSDSSSGADHVGGMAKGPRNGESGERARPRAAPPQSKRSEEPGSCQFAQCLNCYWVLLIARPWYGSYSRRAFALLSIMEVEPAQPKPDEAVTADATPAAAVAAPAAMELEDNSNTASVSSGAPNKKRKSEGASKRLEIDPLGLPATSKRERKTVAVFEAEDFQAAAVAKAESRTHLDGRGTKLEDIPSTCESIKAAKMKGQELKMAHQLVFGGASKEKLRKQQLLEFSGYLPTKSDEEEQKAIDDKLEVCRRMCCYYDVLIKSNGTVPLVAT